MGKTQSAGNRGEAAVARYLRQKGYTLLESQWRCRFGTFEDGRDTFSVLYGEGGSGYVRCEAAHE